MPDLDLQPDRVATGGAALGRGPDGRVVLATGALPGDRVRVRVTAEAKRHLEAEVTEVLSPGPGRRPAPCPAVAEGCGGCDWQHATEDRQRELRLDIVVDCLRRLARIEDPRVLPGPMLDGVDYRTTVRAAVVGGRAGYRHRRSHDVVHPDDCLVAHPLVEELLVDGRFGVDATEVVLRAGARTGERLALITPTAEGVRLPDDVIVVGADEVDAGRQAHHHERIGDRTLRISARSFFQCRPDGAEVLIDLVDRALGEDPGDGPLLDAYAGVGLFGALLGRDRELIGIESSPWSAADAVHNYPTGAEVVRARVERWRVRPVAAVVADPARAGLGRAGVDRLAATGARRLVLVSCDPASLARDAGLLAGHGFSLGPVTVVDLFGQTSHVETVAVFDRP